MVGVKTVAAGLVPAESVLAFLDPVLHLATAIVNLHNLPARQLGVADNKTDSWEEFSRMPFDLADHSARLAPALGLINRFLLSQEIF